MEVIEERHLRNKLSLEQQIAIMKENGGSLGSPPSDPSAAENNYTALEIAHTLKLSVDKVRRMFQDEKGVIVIGDESTRYKRRYTTLRIPESVLQRVVHRISNV